MKDSSNIEAEKEQRAQKFINSVIKNYKIFVDTCSLLDESADKFWDHVIPALKAGKTALIIPFRVYEEIIKKKEDQSNPGLSQRAACAEEKICKLKNDGLVEIFGNPNDNFADNVFLTVFTQYRMKYNLLLITQDKKLAIDIKGIAESKSVSTENKVLVKRINAYGYLSNTIETDEQSTKSKARTPVNGQSNIKGHAEIPVNEIFGLADTVTDVSGVIAVSSLPSEGDTVMAERDGVRKPIKLVKAGNSGGEGTIFLTDIPNMVAKIYKPGKIDRAKFEKLKVMMSKSIYCKGVCFPMAMLYNSQDEFVGFLMEKAEGKDLQKSVFVPALLKKYFPAWEKKDTVQLCITILQKIKYLHDRNIILGDINPNNILVVSPQDVYFVDTDSYQIEGYPCPVGTINYTAPEIQGKKFGTFLRTIGNERFAVATLLFMIMLPGKPPYALQGGESQIDNIINGDFAYASGEKSNGKAPDGMWRYIWSHLPRFLKDDFYKTFRKGEEHSTEQTRLSDNYWINSFQRYARLLADEKGGFLSNDSMSAELFPTRLKKNINATYVTCALCGQEIEEKNAKQGYCWKCLNEGETCTCKRCGRSFKFTNYQKFILRRTGEICKECDAKLNSIYTGYCCRCNSVIAITWRKKEELERKGKPVNVCEACRNTIFSKKTCSICGDTFEITAEEAGLVFSKGFSMPTRCPTCRNKKASSQAISNHSGVPNSRKKKRGCFITTAVCKYYNKPDNCYELELLRNFRDTWLAAQPDGKELIEEYYDIAPDIVTALNASDEKDKVYKHIWSTYIEPCIRLIELDAKDACKNLYIKMVNELKSKFI